MAIILSLVSGVIAALTLGVASPLGFSVSLLAGLLVSLAVFTATSSSSKSASTNKQSQQSEKSVNSQAKKDKKQPKKNAPAAAAAAGKETQAASKPAKQAAAAGAESTGKKSKAKAAAPAPPPPQPEPEVEEVEDEEEQEQDDDEEQESGKAAVSKNAKKKAKKREAERKKKEEEEKKKAEEESKKKAEEKKKADAAKKAAKPAQQQQQQPQQQQQQAQQPAAKSAPQQAKQGKQAQAVPQQQQQQQPQAQQQQQAAPQQAAGKGKGGKQQPQQQEKQQPVITDEDFEDSPTSPSANTDDGWEVIKSNERVSASQRSKAAAAAAAKDASNNSQSSQSGDGDRQVAVEISVPSKNHATLIGQGGKTLTTLRNATSVDIQMPKKDSGDTRVILKGTASNVAACRGAIEALISKGYSSITHPGWVHDDLNVPESQIGNIVGKGGEFLKRIQTGTGATIKIPPANSKEKVVLTGTKEAVKAAKAAIKQLLNEGFNQYTHEGQEKFEFEFPQEKVGWLVGPGGQTIKSIMGDTKTKINIPKTPNSEGEFKVNIIGQPDNIARAHKQILKLLEPKEVPVEEEDEPLDDNVNPFSAQNTNVNEDDLWA